MYEIRYKGDKWEVHTQGYGAYEGTLLQIFVFLMDRVGFTYDDIREGIEEMFWHDNDTAHFGIYKSFIYSYNYADKKKRVA
jgi:hypothetical protein